MARITRKAKRYLKRLEAEFSAGGKAYKGFLSNVSEAGLFIRTSRSFVEGSEIDIKIYLPNDKTCEVKGIVRRAITGYDIRLFKNGMGVELTHQDRNFIDFINEIGEGRTQRPVEEPVEEKKPTREEPEAFVLECPACGAKNKVPAEKFFLGPKCEACKASLRPKDEPETPRPEAKEVEFLIIECPGCGVKNKVPADKLSLGPRCGGCREPLRTE